MLTTIVLLLLFGLVAVLVGCRLLSRLPADHSQRAVERLQRTADQLELDYRTRQATLDAQDEVTRWQRSPGDPAEPPA